MVQPQNALDPIIYFADGSTLDTNANILTRAGRNPNTTPQPAPNMSIPPPHPMANGSYLNSKTNILTMADGTQIDTVTGLMISTTA